MGINLVKRVRDDERARKLPAAPRLVLIFMAVRAYDPAPYRVPAACGLYWGGHEQLAAELGIGDLRTVRQHIATLRAAGLVQLVDPALKGRQRATYRLHLAEPDHDHTVGATDTYTRVQGQPCTDTVGATDPDTAGATDPCREVELQEDLSQDRRSAPARTPDVTAWTDPVGAAIDLPWGVEGDRRKGRRVPHCGEHRERVITREGFANCGCIVTLTPAQRGRVPAWGSTP